ncbi:MAG TPA: sterol desaturase family protein [Burkholderiales bacterium]|jgi:sterol desaturase/sphingolipid hydroxylase (fatty acid hydroxylase superfamily)|nr:sterol desaturase family protein [Burkholderiales bacterium]
MIAPITIAGWRSQIGQPTPPWAVTWLTWPVLFIANIGLDLHAIAQHWDYSTVMTALLAINVVVLVVLEAAFPVERRWKMTWRTFGRDLKYLAAGGATVAAVNGLFGLASIRLNAGHAGPISDWPLYLSVPAALLAVDLVNYWQHRWSHELKGRLGQFLWSTHVAHHLPQQVYVFMHVAAHPLNAFLVRGFVNLLPLYLLGASPETVMLASTVVALQGVVSHCNLDLRAGWLNYVFVGTELHRYHHSADLSESMNYAATLSFIDIAFGTFYYRPGRVPRRLGVSNPDAYPDSNDFWKVMQLPFRTPAK